MKTVEPLQRPTGCERLGAALKVAREGRGQTQRSLAQLLGVRRTTIACWENGHRSIAAEDLARVESALEVSIDGADRQLISPRGRRYAKCAGRPGQVLTITSLKTDHVLGRIEP